MNVVVVSGIWPPDVGGPASHAPALAEILLEGGHGVEVVTTADAEPAPRPYRVRWVSRSRPAALRHLAVVREVRASGPRAPTGSTRPTMVRRAALGAALARRPLVVKLVADEAFERERRSGRFDGTLEEFQKDRGGLRVRRCARPGRPPCAARAGSSSRAPTCARSRSAGDSTPARVTVVPNPAPELPPLPSREEARAGLAVHGFALGTAGRLTAQKALGDALEAVARVDGVELLVLGDGPERSGLERHAAALGIADRVRFLGAGTRDDVVALFRAVDVGLLTSAWENLPHTLLEALAVGTPVIATAVGGIPEVVVDGENGVLVPAGDVAAIAAAIERLRTDDELRGALAGAAAPSVEELSEPRILERIVQAVVGEDDA